MTPTWRVIRVRTRQERSVAKALAALAAWSLHEDVRLTRYPRGRQNEGVQVDVRVPLLPGYVFARCRDDDLELVRNADDVLPSFTPGVPGIARPLSRQSVSVMHQLMNAERLGAFDHRPRGQGLPAFVNGELVMVAMAQADPLIGKVIRSETRARRIRLLMNWLGAPRELEVDIDKVQALCLA